MAQTEEALAARSTLHQGRKELSQFRKIIEEVISRQFECGLGLLPRHALEILEKLFHRLTSRQGVEQRLDGHARGVETRRATHAVGIDPNQPEQRMARLDQIAEQVFRRDRSHVRDQRSLSKLGHRPEHRQNQTHLTRSATLPWAAQRAS